MTIKKLQLIIKIVRNIEQEKGAMNLVVENAKLKGVMAEKGYSVRLSLIHISEPTRPY